MRSGPKVRQNSLNDCTDEDLESLSQGLRYPQNSHVNSCSFVWVSADESIKGKKYSARSNQCSQDSLVI